MVYDLGIIKRQKAMASPIAAAGGVITNIGSSTIHTFTSSGVFQPLTRNGTSPQLTVSYLVVAGGGGGGVGVDRTNGGGGAGGLISSSGFVLSTGTTYTVTVGAGGVPGSSGTYSRIADPTEITYSGYFTGGSYLSIPNSAVFDFGSGNFTFESWIHPTSLSAQGIILAKTNDSSQYGQYELRLNTNGTLVLYVSTGGTTWNLTLTTATALSINTWYHIALTRNTGGVFTIWINGTSAATVTNNLTIWTSTWPVTIGNYRSGTSTPFTGYLSNYRIVKGTALYTTAFTPPLSVLTSATTGTSLLTLQNATFVDNSINNFTITATGSPTTTSTIVPPFGQFAYGGGSGGGITSGAAAIGGSGGGAKHGLTGAVGISGQGQAGGTGYDGGGGGPWTAGGGGGKGGVGGNGSASKPGDGGVAGSSSISGTLAYYAGGGGGGFMNSSGGTGLGGGTATTAQKGGGGDGNTSNVTGAGSSGTANTGGGGGGSGAGTPGYASGTGGSGVVIISYPNPAYTAPLTKQSDPYFKSNSLLLSSNPPTTTTIPVEYLIVGGGGGGSYGHDDFYGGSGGGAGGAFLGTANISSGYTIALTVGAGGAGGTIGSTSTNGINTTITTALSKTSIAYGGGYGAYPTGIAVNSPGGDGGSGGGGYFSNGSGNPSANGHGIQPASSTGGYGNDSGTGNTGNGLGASGGGAGTAGYDYNAAVNAGQGGSGKLFSSFSMYGTDASNSTSPSSGKGYFAGGGGAGNWYIQGNRAGGVGGGGAGSGTSTGSPGLANTGGGGGGGGGGGYNGGAGGSGIVIIRYSDGYPPAAATSGSPTIITTSGYTYYVFTSGGSIQLGSTSTTPNVALINNTTFIDSSANALTITPTGTPTQGTFTPFGNNWSNYFSASTGQYLIVGTSVNLALGAGDFTIELWVNMAATNATASTLLDWRTNGLAPSNIPALYINPTNYLIFDSTAGTTVFTSSIPILLNNWNHIAITRSGSSMTMYLNGISVATATNSVNYGIQTFNVNSPQSSSVGLVGYISNLRIVKGTALYTSNFTPATAPLPVVTNTVLLTSASNRFMDKNSTATITAVGTPNVSHFSPFNNLGAYNSTLIGGSAYFNGTTDYLKTQKLNAVSTGDFTFECWAYITAYGSTSAFFTIGDEASGRYYFALTGGGGQLWSNVYGGANFTWGTSTSVPLNQWTHIAWVRVGTTVTGYVNGISVGTQTISGTVGNSGGITIGANPSGGYLWTGYLSNIRIVNGGAVYTSAFTPPAAPIADPYPSAYIDTYWSSVNFLINADSGSLVDRKGTYTLSAIGTTAVNTSIKKFGAGSVAVLGGGNVASLQLVAGDITIPAAFTLDGWVYLAASGRHTMLGSPNGNAYSTTYGFGIFDTTGVTTSTKGLCFMLSPINGYSGNMLYTGQYPTLNTWTHFAIQRDAAGAWSIYMNGVKGTLQNDNAFVASNSQFPAGSGPTGSLNVYGLVGNWDGFVSGGNSSQYSAGFNGYLDDFRLTLGVARYSGNTFVPPTIDAYTLATSPYTSLLLNNTNTGIYDATTNNDIVTVGTAALSTTVTKFNSRSMYFNGSTDYLSIPYNTFYDWAKSACTIEMWVYPTAFGGNRALMSKSIYPGTSTNNWEFLLNATGNVVFRYWNGSSQAFTSSATVSLNTWSHVAFTYNGSTTLALYINGIASGTFAYVATAEATAAVPLLIGLSSNGSGGGAAFFSGYIDDLRVTNGVARYTAAFTPTTQTLPQR